MEGMKTENTPAEEQDGSFTTGTPYDDAFRTMTNDCSDLLIPVINEIFGKNYPADAKVYLARTSILSMKWTAIWKRESLTVPLRSLSVQGIQAVSI